MSAVTPHGRGVVPNANGEAGPPGYSPRLDDVLPAGLEFRDEGERLVNFSDFNQ